MKWTGKDWFVLLAMIGYCAWPVDLLPDFLGPFAWLDDAAVVVWGIKHFANKKAKNNGTPEIKLHPVAEEEVIEAEFEVKAS